MKILSKKFARWACIINNVVVPDTFNDDKHVEALFKVAFPDIFNFDINVEGLLKLTNEGGFNIEL